ncbi:PAS domain S-box protein [Sulfurimonas sp.]|uniref:PAS domain S-box protein n=1 Tax=Sulfurimonas sp. TaxID=2022749 RepID=UPI00356987A3
MEPKDLLFDVVNTLSSPIILLDTKDTEYTIIYVNEEMQRLLENEAAQEIQEDEEPKELSLTNDFLNLLSSYKNESNSDNFTLYDVEVFGKIYNINFSKNSNHLFITFIEISIERLFENITFHNLSGACSAIVVVLDAQGKLIDMNDCFLNSVGMTKDEAYEKPFFETFIPGDMELLNHYLEELMTNESPHQQFVTPMKGIDDEVFRINWQVSKVVKQDQNFIIAVGSDISKFVEQNSNLKKQIQSIKVGFDYFPFAIGYMNVKGEFIKMNSSFLKMFRIKDEGKKISFDQIPLFKKSIGFIKMQEHIKLIKEMSYKVDHIVRGETVKLKINIKMLSGKQETSKFYIVVAQKVTI